MIKIEEITARIKVMHNRGASVAHIEQDLRSNFKNVVPSRGYASLIKTTVSRGTRG